MRKVIFCMGLVTVLLLAGFSVVSATENEASNIKETNQVPTKAGTVYGPFKVPSIMGTIFLIENASYTTKHHIGNLYIYRNLKLTALVCGPGPQSPDEPRYNFYIGQFPFIGGRIVNYKGNAILTMKLWIGQAIAESVGSDTIFMGHYGQGFDVTLETLE